jgi:hypothetical protein
VQEPATTQYWTFADMRGQRVAVFFMVIAPMTFCEIGEE